VPVGDTIGHICRRVAVNSRGAQPLNMHRPIPETFMPLEANNMSQPLRTTRPVPRAVWVGGGLLSLVTAGLAGALIMRTAGPAPEPVVATPATVDAVAPVVPVVAAPQQAVPAKPVHHAKAAAPQPAATAQASTNLQGGTAPVALCSSCGTVESVTAVQEKGQGTGLGAVAGGVLGGVVGHQVGGGNGKTAMTVLGAIGGGLAGNEVEKRARSETLYDVRVRMEDGSTRSFQRAQSLAVGTRVVVEGSALRVAREAARNNDSPVIRTSAPAGSSS
jgi:outer membrane lipoprotein SlyB